MWLTRFCIQRPIIVAMFFIGLLVFGTMSFFALGRSLNPNVTFPIVIVSANYPGASPAEMERLVIKPIEDQMDGIDNLDRMSATAQEGTAVVVVQFKLNTNLDFAAIDVQRRVDTARVFMPTDLDPPFVDKSAGNQQSPILTIAAASKSLSRTQLSDLIVDRIVPDIKHIPNIQSVDVRGEVKREFHVFPVPQRLEMAGATLPDVFQALQSNNANLPGGRLDAPTSETSVSVHAEINRATDMLPITLPVPGGAKRDLRVGSVAWVEDGHVDRRYISKFRGEPTTVLYVNRILTADEISSTAIARERLKVIEKKYPQVQFTEVEAPAEYTQASLNGVVQSLGEGILLTAIVLMLFLHAWRNAIVVMVAIPSSILATFVAMRMFGFTLDIVSLMGLSLTIGILVDDSIVVLENITRHRDLGEKPEEAALTGRGEIGGAAVAITLVDVVVFLPIAFLSGIVGKFMQEFGIVVVVATLFSLFVSFTLTPLLAAKWSMVKRSSAPPRWLAWFQVFYNWLLRLYHAKLLPFALTHRGTTAFACFTLVFLSLTLVMPRLTRIEVAAALGLLVLAVWVAARGFAATPWARNAVAAGEPSKRRAKLLFALSSAARSGSGKFGKFLIAAGFALAVGLVFAAPGTVQSEFIAASQTGDIQMTFTYPVGTPIRKTDQAIDRFVHDVLQVPGVVNVISTVGYKPAGWGTTQGGNFARIYAGMAKDRRNETNRAIDDIRKIAVAFPGATITVAGEGGGGGGDPIYFTLSGPEDQIDKAATKLATFIRSIPGTINVQTGSENEGNRLNINIDRAKAAVLGVNPGEAAIAARIAVGGAVATKVRTQSGLVDVRVQLPAEFRNQIDQVRNVRVRALDGSMYRLADVATFDYGKAPTKIERLDKQRVVRVTGGMEPGKTTLGEVMGQIQAKVKQPGFLPDGVGLRASGDSQFFQETVSSMGIAALTSAALVYMLMVILYGSFLSPFIIMLSVPLAIMGALFGLALTGQTLNLFSMIGMIMLFGLVAKNGILLVDYANTLRRRGLRYKEAIVQAAETRFRPIVMTTASMVFGMLPLALGLAEGAEFRKSMGTVLIGGLISSLILTLFLVPVIYTWVIGRVERNEQRRAAKHLETLPELEPAGVAFSLER